MFPRLVNEQVQRRHSGCRRRTLGETLENLWRTRARFLESSRSARCPTERKISWVRWHRVTREPRRDSTSAARGGVGVREKRERERGRGSESLWEKKGNRAFKVTAVLPSAGSDLSRCSACTLQMLKETLDPRAFLKASNCSKNNKQLKTAVLFHFSWEDISGSQQRVHIRAVIKDSLQIKHKRQ